MQSREKRTACKVVGCSRSTHARGYCKQHYDPVPHSCPAINEAQAKMRRIWDWAEENGHDRIALLAHEAWDEIESVRGINKSLRRRKGGEGC